VQLAGNGYHHDLGSALQLELSHDKAAPFLNASKHAASFADAFPVGYLPLEVEMLELLDSGRIAHKLGKWRWSAYFATAICLFFFGWGVSEVLMIPSLMSPVAADSSPAFWTFAGFSLASLLLILYSVRLCYIDEMHGAYIDDAEHYRLHGW
jgi:hypothetical protein